MLKFREEKVDSAGQSDGDESESLYEVLKLITKAAVVSEKYKTLRVIRIESI